MVATSRSLQYFDGALAGLVALALSLDLPSAQAYNEHLAFTELAGRYLFHGVKELSGLPVPFTPFELLSYSFLLLALCLRGFPRSRILGPLLASILVLPLLAGLALGLGLWRGHSLELALTQLHFLPMLGVWLWLGSYLGQRPHLQARLLRIVFWVCVWRASYAWYVYLAVYGGSLGEREFLIDHASSMILALGLAYGSFQMLAQRQRRARFLGYACACLWILGPYLLNERRASFAGGIAGLLILPWILPPLLRRRLWPVYRKAALVGTLLFVVLAIQNDDLNSFTGAIKSEAFQTENLSYRHIENYDLLLGLIEYPLTGMGFGRDFPQVLPLPDISFTFPLYTAIPHNNVYYLWAFAGPLGLAGLMSLSSILWILIVRCGRLALRRADLLLAVMGLVTLSQWLLYVFFDMGLIESRMMMLVGIFAGGLFPCYARILGDHYEARNHKDLWVRNAGESQRVRDTDRRSGLQARSEGAHV